MGHSKLKDYYEKVEELTDDETTEVYVVPGKCNFYNHGFIHGTVLVLLSYSLIVYVLQEEIDQFITFFFLIFNESCGRPFTKELHEAALHHDPEHPGQVEQKSQEDEIKRDPLVV